jgi:predicted dithiol-disulfide oxidoreductase (DUF899 family)
LVVVGLEAAAPCRAVVAKTPLPRLLAFAEERGWRRLWFLSSATNTYNVDYHADA